MMVLTGLICFQGIAQEEEEEEEDSIHYSTPGPNPNDTFHLPSAVSPPGPQGLEIFSSGFIDIFNSGQISASARFIRLFVGEPGKFTLPVSLYAGVTSNSFQKSPGDPHSNELLVTNFINPLSGLANVSIEGIAYFKKKPKLTRAGMLYQFGERVLTGFRAGEETDPDAGNPYNFMNTFGSVGLYFQTGAWERTNTRNIGVTWLALRYLGCYSHPSQLKKFLPDINTNGFYHGYSLAWGIDITRLLNIKLVHYKYIKKPEINYSMPIYQFSFNYTFKK